MFQDRVVHFGENLREQVKGRSPKKLRLLIAVPYVAHLNVQALSFNMILFSSPSQDPRLGKHFLGRLATSGKRSFTEKAKIVDRGSLFSTPECIGSKVQYEPHLFSVAHS